MPHSAEGPTRSTVYHETFPSLARRSFIRTSFSQVVLNNCSSVELAMLSTVLEKRGLRPRTVGIYMCYSIHISNKDTTQHCYWIKPNELDNGKVF